MKKVSIAFVVFIALWTLPFAVSAKTIEEVKMRDGRVFYGHTLKDLPGKLLFRTVEQTNILLPFNKIISIKKRSAGKHFGTRSWVALGICGGVGVGFLVSGWLLKNYDESSKGSADPKIRAYRRDTYLGLFGAGGSALVVGVILAVLLREKVTFRSKTVVPAKKRMESLHRSVQGTSHVMLFSTR